MRVRGAVRPPGDKSISHRALMLAALAHGRSELAGLLTGEDVKSTARVLRQLGAVISPIRDGGTVTVHTSRITHPASRLHCGAVSVREPYLSRDHTERLFLHLGLDLRLEHGAISFHPPATTVPPFRLSIPGDASSAAFLVAAAVLAEGGELAIENAGVNPTRTGFLVVLERMGARVERVNLRDEGGEPVADLIARPAALQGTVVTAAEVPTLVDEVPILAVLASRAEGETVFREVGELRVKESNRLELIAANLRAVGVAAEAQGNDLHVRGTTRPPGGRVETARDHRLAMAFAVLATLPGADVRLSERASVAISYPGFFRDLERMNGARHRD